VNDQRKIYGASFGVAAKVTDAITSRLDWFYSQEDDVTIDYTDKAGSMQGDHALTTVGGVSSETPHPGIDPTQPYSIDPNGVIQSGTFNATARDRNPVSALQEQGEQPAVEDLL